MLVKASNATEPVVDPWVTCFLTGMVIRHLDSLPGMDDHLDYHRVMGGGEGFDHIRDPKAFLLDPNNWVPHVVLRELIHHSEEASGCKDVTYRAALAYFASSDKREPTLMETIVAEFGRAYVLKPEGPRSAPTAWLIKEGKTGRTLATARPFGMEVEPAAGWEEGQAYAADRPTSRSSEHLQALRIEQPGVLRTGSLEYVLHVGAIYDAPYMRYRFQWRERAAAPAGGGAAGGGSGPGPKSGVSLP